MLRIGPFNYDPLRGVDLWLSQPDEFILQHLSTSPDVEPAHFVMQVIIYCAFSKSLFVTKYLCPQVRATLKFIQTNQFPAITIFRDNRPRYYRRDENTGCWQIVRY